MRFRIMQNTARLSRSFLVGAAILVAAGLVVGALLDRTTVQRTLPLLSLLGALTVASAIGIPPSWRVAQRALFLVAFSALGVSLGLLAQFFLP
jgi:hypothetical protein